jgi:predicted flap endonuclease-1-like 5' DNA nuclease
MRAFKVFIFGLLYGWVLKIAFDRIYRDNAFADLRYENMSLRDYILSLEEQLQSRSLEAKYVQREHIDLQAGPKTAAAPTPAASASEKDNLKLIKGIGPAIERKLNDAGVQTFAALAALSVEQLQSILGNTRRLVQEGNLIVQAKKLARKR